MHYISTYDSPLGGITLASDGNRLTGLWFQGQKYYADTLPEAFDEKPLALFDEVHRWLDIYFSGRIPDFMPPLAAAGSPFRMAVWAILMQIPYGQVITYRQISQQLAQQRGLSAMSAQAVGGAVAHNPISILIPCHRVVGSDGSLTGYAGGIAKKRRLLMLEGVDMAGLYIPKKGTAL